MTIVCIDNLAQVIEIVEGIEIRLEVGLPINIKRRSYTRFDEHVGHDACIDVLKLLVGIATAD